jgi:hypothetical protein
MTRIKNKSVYTIKEQPVKEDYFIGSDSENNGITVNYTLDSITSYIQSQLGIESQDNKGKLINFGSAYSPFDGQALVSEAINNITPPIEVKFDEIPIFRGFVSKGRLGMDYNTYMINNYSKGIYGQGGDIILTESDIILIETQTLGGVSTPVFSDDPNAEVIQLGEIPDGNFLNVINSSPTITVEEGTNVYFDFTVQGLRYVYSFVGANGSYGIGGNTMVEEDVVLIYDETKSGKSITSVTGEGVDNTDPQNPVISQPVYDINLVGGTNNIELTQDGNIISTIDISPYLDDTNLSRLVSGTISGNTLTVTRDDATTFDIDVSSLVPQDLAGYRETGSLLSSDFLMEFGDFDDVDGEGKVVFDVSGNAINFEQLDVIIKNGSLLSLAETDNDQAYIGSYNISGSKNIELPNNSGTLVSTVNGNSADANGNVNTSSYKTYFASVAQTGTSNPTTTVYEDFDTPVTWTRTDAGKYVSNIPNNPNIIPIVHNSLSKIDGTTTEFYQVTILGGFDGFIEIRNTLNRASGSAVPSDNFSRLIELRDYS